MKKIVSILFILLPLIAIAQNKPLTKKQSMARLEALKKLSKEYVVSQCIGNNIIVFDKNSTKDGCGMVDINGKQLLPPEYSYIEKLNNSSLLVVCKDNKAGFIDRNGRFVTPLQYEDDIYVDGWIGFINGLMVVRHDEEYGIMDSTGSIVVPSTSIYNSFLFIYENGRFFTNFSYDTDKEIEILMRINGDTIMEAESISPFDNGKVRVKKNGLWGIYDTLGNEILKCQYDWIGICPNGLLSVKEGDRWLLIDWNGREHFQNLKLECNYLEYGKSGLVSYDNDGECGVVDTTGQIVIPPKVQYIYYESKDRIVMHNPDDGSIHIYDTKGHLTDSYQDSKIYQFEEDYVYNSRFIPVQKDGLYGLVDSDWNLVVPCRFKDLDALNQGYFVTPLGNGIYGVVDSTGKMVFKVPCRWPYPIGDGVYSLETSLRNNTNRITAFADIYGNTTLSKEEYATMQRQQLQAEEEERISREKRMADIEAKRAEAEKRRAEEKNKATDINPETDEHLDEVFVVVEEMPKFPGGDSALYMFLCMNLSYPEEARENEIEGTVVISFVIEKDGSVSNVRCMRDIGGGCGEAAIEVVKAMPRWEPGRQQGKAVNTQFTLPLKFELSDENGPTYNMSQEEKCHFLLNKSAYK